MLFCILLSAAPLILFVSHRNIARYKIAPTMQPLTTKPPLSSLKNAAYLVLIRIVTYSVLLFCSRGLLWKQRKTNCWYGLLVFR